MRKETADILSLLENYALPSADDIATHIASDFRARRIEKGVSRREIATRADVPLSNVARFEQKGLISLSNLIKIAVALGYSAEIKGIFSEPKFSTIEELTQIRKNAGKKKAYTKRNDDKN
ncbi:MAG: helix-turn-helix domain-containing protein [Muribaculaceae bacterium]|nr:helix-turn-helix domain-containing protein [Muribaculaceae bacterium]